MVLRERIDLPPSTLWIGDRCLTDVFTQIDWSGISRVFVISQAPVWQHHGDWLCASLQAAAVTFEHHLIADGEQVKNLAEFERLMHLLANRGADRKSLLIVLGGGVVGDLCGMVAAAYMRGMRWLYIPTTLLAQQDASIGGKVAVNLPQGKNLVGFFWPPDHVVICPHVLETLPQREINAGYMELLKHGMLHHDELYHAIAHLPLTVPDWLDYLPLLINGLKVKVAIVREDPTEQNQRRLLNLGHTLGHAIENVTGYQTLLHGEAVGLGLIYAACLGQELGGEYDWSLLIKAVRSRLPQIDYQAWQPEELLARTRLDKKGVAGVVTWIVPFAPGHVELMAGIEDSVLQRALDRFFATLR